MGFIIEEHDRHSDGENTRLINTTTGLILGNAFTSTPLNFREERQPIRGYEKLMDDDLREIFRRQLSRDRDISRLQIEKKLNTVIARTKGQDKHMNHVERYSIAIGKALHIADNDLLDLALAAKLHDIGKAFVSPEILNKPGKLSKEEMNEVKKHPEKGYWILKADVRYRKIAEYVRHHHERWDGLGYPLGLKGEEIPLFSRIIAVADAYDAMTTNRVYQLTKSREEAFRELIEHSGSQFDPKIVKTFVDKVFLRFHTSPSVTK